MKYLLLTSLFFLTSCTFGSTQTNIDDTGTITAQPIVEVISGSTMTGSISHSGKIIQIEWSIATERDQYWKKLTANEAKLSKEGEGGYREYAFTPNQWTILISSIDPHAFDILPEYPATFCPSCADSSEESIRIIYESGSKRVSYGLSDSIPAIDNLKNELRRLYSQDKTIQTGISKIEWTNNPGIEACSQKYCIGNIILKEGDITYTEKSYNPESFSDKTFTGTLTSLEWQSLMTNLGEESFSGLDESGMFPPDYPIETLLITRDGQTTRYVFRSDANTNEPITTLLRNIEELQSQLRSSNSEKKILKIQKNIDGMAGSTEVIFESGALTLQGYGDYNPIKYRLSSEAWDDLNNSIDLDIFLKLDQKDERFRCKECSDDGDNMETLSITYTNGSRSLYYGSKNNIKELSKIRKTIGYIFQGMQNSSLFEKKQK